jgi:hypothetical protein
MVLVNSGFPHIKKISGRYPQFGHRPSKMFTSPVLDHHRNNQKYGAGTLRFPTHKKISLEVIHNLGTGPQKCSPALF